ncbi:hypothetical protein [Amycolatopsis sp. NPDC004079]|uniref:deazapurine DNA modification protein DpdA family protein n=1 Tax=Amycolatopsis sp. NPDC004079 TaxID=3154549 RepID=UPI0033A64CD0
MKFYLGTHRPAWIARTIVPLFVSDRTLRGYKTLPRAIGTWALDSGGFTQLSQYGTWSSGPAPREYAARVRRYRDEIGGLQLAAPQDWMAEPSIRAKTGLTVREHQARTVGNFLELREIAPDLPFIPVLQGWTSADYVECVAKYVNAGVDLAAEPTVGIGSVCRRQGTDEVAGIVAAVREAVPGIALHGFGVKLSGLGKYGSSLASADSLSWSMAARRERPLPGCTGHKSCANCPRFAFRWRERVLASMAGHATSTIRRGTIRMPGNANTSTAQARLTLAAFRGECADLERAVVIHAARSGGMSLRGIATLVGLPPARVGRIAAAYDPAVSVIDRVRELRRCWGVDDDPATSAAADTITAALVSYDHPQPAS